MKKHIVLIIVLSLLALWPFFKKGYFETHDGDWIIIRFSAFHQTLAAGQIPVRFVDRLNNNYGYPVFNFLYPLPFYLAEIPRILGFGFVESIKIITIAATLGSVVAMFWALSQKFKKEASFAGAVIYLFAPYRFVDLYVRGSFGENVAFLFIPLILGSILKIIKGNKLFLPMLSFFIAGLILSHNVMAFLFLPILLVIGLILAKSSRINIFAAFLGGLIISLFYWLPALYDLQFVKFSQIKISEISVHLVNFSRLIIPSWGFGNLPSGENGFSPQIGIVAIALFISAIIFRLVEKKKNLIVDFSLILFLLSAFLMLGFSLSFWILVPLTDLIQFPWRLLAIIVFASSILSAYVIDKSDQKLITATIIILAAVISTAVYTKPKAFIEREEPFYSTNEDTTTVRDEYMPIWVKEKPHGRANEKSEIVSGNARIVKQTIKAVNYKTTIESESESEILVNSVYFPGWQVKVDGQNQIIDYQNKNGLITFRLSKGKHEAIIRYGKTPIHLISEIISLLSFIGVSSYFLFRAREHLKFMSAIRVNYTKRRKKIPRSSDRV